MRHQHHFPPAGPRLMIAAARPPAAAVNRRGIVRTPLTLLGRLQTLHGTRTVQLLDVSRWGSMVEGAPVTIKVGSEAILKCHQLDVFATVHWVSAGRCGIKFDVPIDSATIRALEMMSEQLGERPNAV